MEVIREMSEAMKNVKSLIDKFNFEFKNSRGKGAG